MASIPHPLTLTGRLVTLEPLAEAHLAPLLEIAMAAPDIYRFTSTPTTPAEAERYFAQAFRERGAGTAYPFAVRQRASGELVGSSRFYKLDYSNRSCEIGFT
ncbi:GNAT family N-acetyltransferase, partial [Escherichia coli]|uniref:GNAT family N-acetyltransferase n=1 Tax=Escherichia coli TaxID=562 RepID=UPI001369E6DA